MSLGPITKQQLVCVCVVLVCGVLLLLFPFPLWLAGPAVILLGVYMAKRALNFRPDL